MNSKFASPTAEQATKEDSPVPQTSFKPKPKPLKPIRELFNKSLLLAPMEEVTDISYRIICKELGADVVYTEFVNSDGLVRGRGREKMEYLPAERPIGIQIYGNDTENMVSSACIAEEFNPDIIDINAGCWVKKVAVRGAGAGLLKNPSYMQKLIGEVVRSVRTPVTVKTRLGWDEENINIIEVAKRLEQVGVQALTLHCRTRCQGHAGEANWKWIKAVKEAVNIPVILNGSILTPEDAVRAFQETPADSIMIARGAIGYPWIFREIKELQKHGRIVTQLTLRERISVCLRHLRTFIHYHGERVGIPAFRKYYAGYLKGFPQIVKVRVELMKQSSYSAVEDILNDYQDNFYQR